MITTPKGMDNFTRAGVGKNSKTQTTAYGSAKIEFNYDYYNVELIGGPTSGTLVLTEKKDTA